MSIVIVPVTTKREMKQFICFNYELYKDSPYAVPDLYSDVCDPLDPKKNAAYEIIDDILGMVTVPTEAVFEER